MVVMEQNVFQRLCVHPHCALVGKQLPNGIRVGGSVRKAVIPAGARCKAQVFQVSALLNEATEK